MTNMSVATSTRLRDKSKGESVEEPWWHRVTFYDRGAEIAGACIKKDASIYADGRLRYGKYTGSGGGRIGPSGQKGAGEEGSRGRRLPAPRAHSVCTAASAEKPPITTNDIDENIPF